MSIAFVQAAGGNTTSTSPATTSSITTTKGNLVVLFAGANVTGTFSASDNKGNVWKQAGAALSGTSVFGAVFYSVLDTGGSGHTFTVANNGSLPNLALIAQEFSGLWAFPFDVSATSSGTAGTITSGNTAVTNYASELVVGVGLFTSGSETAGAGFSNFTNQDDGSGSNSAGMESKIVSTTGVQAATWGGASSFWIAGAATFHERVRPTTVNIRPHAFSPGLAR